MPFSIRRATLADLDDLVDISVAANEDNDMQDYLEPHRDDTPEAACVNRDFWYSRWFNAVAGEPKTDKLSEGATSVALLVDLVSDDQKKPIPVNTGIWQFPAGFGLTEKEERETMASARAPASATTTSINKAPAASETVSPCRAAWRAEKDRSLTVTFPNWPGYAPRMVFSGNNTRPKYHRRGAATENLRWGLALADKRGLPVMLRTSQRGRRIYKRFGFELLDPMKVPVEGEDWELWRDVMVRMPGGGAGQVKAGK